MTRTAGALIGRRRSSAFWGLGCPKTHHEIKDSLGLRHPCSTAIRPICPLPNRRAVPMGFCWLSSATR
ncbi:MAG: hypothetical protein ABW170_05985 [Candidatus Thiodiazotropha sp. L084R]